MLFTPFCESNPDELKKISSEYAFSAYTNLGVSADKNSSKSDVRLNSVFSSSVNTSLNTYRILLVFFGTKINKFSIMPKILKISITDEIA